MSHIEFAHTIPTSLDDAWRLHARDGIVARLTPGFSRMKVRQQTDDLRDGTTIFDLPGGLEWVGQHVPEKFKDHELFTDTCTTPGLGLVTGWTHQHGFSGDDDAATIHDTIHLNAPEFAGRKLLEPVFAYRQNQLLQDVLFLQRAREWEDSDAAAGTATSAATGAATTSATNSTQTTAPRTIAVTGADGLVGTQLCALLSLAGHTIKKLSRSTNWNPDNPAADLLEGVDTLIHLAGHPIAGRFTDEHVKKVEESRVGPTRKLAELAAATDSVTTFVCASAVGFYGHAQSTPVDESGDAGEGILAGVVKRWEEATQPAKDAGVRVVNVRSGLVIARGSPMLDLLSASVKTGGGHLGDGTQHFAWIAIDDVVDIYYRSAIDPEMEGVVNAVAPETVTNHEFTEKLAEVGGGAALIPVPKAAPAVMLGKDGARELALADQNVQPGVLTRMGHTYRYPTVKAALRHELGKEAK